MAAAAILDFWNKQNFIGYWGGEGRDTSACLTLSKSVNRLWRYLVFSGFSRWRSPPSWIVESTKFYWLTVSGGPRRIIILPNFIKIGRSIAAILRFCKFSRWRPPPTWIFQIVNFYLLTVSGGPRRITVPNFVKMVVPLLRYCDFSNYPRGRRRHLGFLKSRNFIHYWGPELRGASACQILSKSVNQLRRY